MDAIQRAAATETYFEPIVGGKPEPVHIFSTAEARECLQDKTIVLAGDSYLKQLYVGLADILLGEPDNENMGYPVRAQIQTGLAFVAPRAATAQAPHEPLCMCYFVSEPDFSASD